MEFSADSHKGFDHPHDCGLQRQLGPFQSVALINSTKDNQGHFYWWHYTKVSHNVCSIINSILHNFCVGQLVNFLKPFVQIFNNIHGTTKRRLAKTLINISLFSNIKKYLDCSIIEGRIKNIYIFSKVILKSKKNITSQKTCFLSKF